MVISSNQEKLTEQCVCCVVVKWFRPFRIIFPFKWAVQQLNGFWNISECFGIYQMHSALYQFSCCDSDCALFKLNATIYLLFPFLWTFITILCYTQTTRINIFYSFWSFGSLHFFTNNNSFIYSIPTKNSIGYNLQVTSYHTKLLPKIKNRRFV